MSDTDPEDLSSFSMLDLFKVEVENQQAVLNSSLLALEEDPTEPTRLEALMRAAHSIKGAARIVNLDVAVNVSHLMEDCFEAIRRNPEALVERSVTGLLDRPDLSASFRQQSSFLGLLTDIMLASTDLLGQIAATTESQIGIWENERKGDIDACLSNLRVLKELQDQSSSLPKFGESVAGSTTTPTPRESDDAPNEEPTDLSGDLSGFSMLDLFKMEVESQKTVITDGLLALETDPADSNPLESLMRAAHSIKGAARIVNLDAAVKIAHLMEDCFELFRKRPNDLAEKSVKGLLNRPDITDKYRQQTTFLGLATDIMLDGIDLLCRIASTPERELNRWETNRRIEIETCLGHLKALRELFEFKAPANLNPGQPKKNAAVEKNDSADEPAPSIAKPVSEFLAQDSFLRITAGNLNRLLGLAGELQLEAQRLKPFSDNLLRLKRKLTELNLSLDDLREVVTAHGANTAAHGKLANVRQIVNESRQFLADRLSDLEAMGRRTASVSSNLYETAIACRMRPFTDGVQGFPRMIRDLARRLGKQVKLEIVGRDTQVDRDILEKLEVQITQLLRNALDHGLETPEERAQAGKSPQCLLTLEARHSNGKLLISVSDDGRGIHYEKLRQSVVAKSLTTAETAARLSEAELLEFLFLPGFSQKEQVTEISGRGVGLDIVYNMVKSVRGTVRIYTNPGHGTRFELQLPLTLSVLRALLVEIDGEPYAFPLAQTLRTLKTDTHEIRTVDQQRLIACDGHDVPVISLHAMFHRPEPGMNGAVSMVLVGERDKSYALQVDRFLGERELVVQSLDARLGKVQDISAGAILEDGSPVLILDVQDLIHGSEKRLSERLTGELAPETEIATGAAASHRVLVVDDSLTVREMERQLLRQAGYEVETAVDGVDALNALRQKRFTLLVTDLDMPRMSGLELTTEVRRDPLLHSLPIIMVTYKDRPEDREAAVAAGVNHFLTKGGFQDETFLKQVTRFIGQPESGTESN